MGGANSNRTWRDEPILAALAFLAIFLVLMLVGVVVLVETTSLAPRSAALIIAGPALFAAIFGARHKSTRRFFGSNWSP